MIMRTSSAESQPSEAINIGLRGAPLCVSEMNLNYELINQCRTPKGGWTKRQLEALRVVDPFVDDICLTTCFSQPKPPTNEQPREWIVKRRSFNSLALGLMSAGSAPAFSQTNDWGASAGYPTGWGSPQRMSWHKHTRVGNYSGGFEAMLPNNKIQAGAESPLIEATRDIRYQWGLSSRGAADYMAGWPVTGLLIARRGKVWFERYGYERGAEMRMNGWSMSKGVTSLLLGIALDQGRVKSLEDRADIYVPSLKGTLHGETTLRNLMNMSSGAAVVHAEGNQTIYPDGLIRKDSSIESTVKLWNARQEPQGARFNYNELCPLTIGMVLRAATGTNLSEFAQEALWKPMGAEGNATWLTDSHKNEFNCVGFAARLRDWARLGQLVVQRGYMNGKQIVSQSWMESYSRWEPNEAQVRPGGMPNNGGGYKAFLWHAKPDGSRLVFSGAEAQQVRVHIPTETVLVQTAVDDAGPWRKELDALFEAAINAS
ncbi:MULTISPECIES: serine hydrolase [unclassified Polaromonas]|uniref:serine hydrolase domain-containing protein n=1 Tax=unclassified Polaromonas TaxID=2638319 RepID=UPI000F079B54|nr:MULTISPECIES: serine hydrolase [unclassified Polaromonas]AYQ28525.1 class C beta-lactamase-related serine hydrolase [Polaromonas sp. SP1]QGJ20359.1 serine hydrolase [Polaromonas sp. Pch-P]